MTAFPWATSLCHSMRGRQPLVIPNRDLWPSVRNLLLLTRNGGDHTLAWREMLRYRSAWHTLGVRFFGAPHLRMTSKCHSERMWGIPGYLFEILHSAYAAFRMTLLSFRTETCGRVWGIATVLFVTVAIVLSLGGRFFKAKPFRMTYLSSRTHVWDLTINSFLGRFFTPLHSVQNDNGVCRRFFLPMVVRMTVVSFRAIARNLLKNARFFWNSSSLTVVRMTIGFARDSLLC